MTGPRYSSRDWYHDLAVIEAKVLNLPCKGGHNDREEAWRDLLEFIRAQREELAIRAARTQTAFEAREARRKEKQDNGM